MCLCLRKLKIPAFLEPMCCTVLCLVSESHPTLCDSMNLACQGPLSMGILQARILDWVAIPSSIWNLYSSLKSEEGEKIIISHIKAGLHK